MTDEAIMKVCASFVSNNFHRNIGGPFGAAVVSQDNELISVACNEVLGTNDPTAHAEIQAIRYASAKLGTHDLSQYKLYATGYPCPMCMSAIMWANIKETYVSGEPEDAAEIGFRDDFMYKFIKNDCDDSDVLKINRLDRNTAKVLYQRYQKQNKEIY